MTTKHDVIRVFKEHPEWTSIEIADELGCCDTYVRATLHRNNLKLAKRTRNHYRDRINQLEQQLSASQEALVVALDLLISERRLRNG